MGRKFRKYPSNYIRASRYIRAEKTGDQRQIDALDRWINFSDETRDIVSRWQRDFAFFLMFFRQRVQEEGYMKYKNMTPQQVEQACADVARHNEELEAEEHEGYHTISMWHDWSERDLITMIKAFAELSPEDRREILSIRSFLDR